MAKKVIPSSPAELVDTIFKVRGTKLNSEDVNRLRSVLRTLTPREETIMKMRFGVDDSIKHTQGEIGQQFGVSKGRIYTQERRALTKLRHPSRAQNLYYLIRGLPGADKSNI